MVFFFLLYVQKLVKQTVPGFSDFTSFAQSMRCSGNSSKFTYLHELYCNELVFILSQVCLFKHH